MLSCKEITENANSYLDRELPFFTRMKVKLHLKMCVHCRRYVDQLQMTIEALKTMKPDDSVSDDVLETIVRSMQDCQHQSNK